MTGDNIDTGSLLMARGFGNGWGGGFGVGGGAYPGYGSFASPSANAVRINRNDQTVRDTNECTRAENRLGLDRISAQNKEDRDNQRFSALEKSITDAEFRSSDRARDIENLMIAGQKEAAQCCCDAKLEACKSNAEIKALIVEKAAATDALILAVEGRSNLDKLAEVRNELTIAKLTPAS